MGEKEKRDGFGSWLLGGQRSLDEEIQRWR